MSTDKTEQALLAIIERAFRDGYCARSTYNDKDTSDVDDEWLKAKPHFAAMLADSPPRAVEPQQSHYCLECERLSRELAAVRAVEPQSEVPRDVRRAAVATLAALTCEFPREELNLRDLELIAVYIDSVTKE